MEKRSEILDLIINDLITFSDKNLCIMCRHYKASSLEDLSEKIYEKSQRAELKGAISSFAKAYPQLEEKAKDRGDSSFTILPTDFVRELLEVVDKGDHFKEYTKKMTKEEKIAYSKELSDMEKALKEYGKST